MQILFRFLLLIVHLSVTAIIIYYIGDFMSQNNDMLFVLIGIVLYLILIASFVFHFKTFLSLIKKLIK